MLVIVKYPAIYQLENVHINGNISTGNNCYKGSTF